MIFMKNYIFISFILTIFLFGCKNEDSKLLLQQQELLEFTWDSKTATIIAMYHSNKVKYKGLYQFNNNLYESYKLVKEDFQNNAGKILSLYKELGYIYGYGTEKLASDIENAKDKNDETLKINLINKYLILINESIFREIIKYKSKGFHYTYIEPGVELEKKEYKLGEIVKANLFVKATDSTQKPLFILKNGHVIDSFDNRGNAVYTVIADKKGKFEVKGILVYQIGGITNIDSTNFEFEYIVK